jgi:hypothetical protein
VFGLVVLKEVSTCCLWLTLGSVVGWWFRRGFKQSNGILANFGIFPVVDLCNFIAGVPSTQNAGNARGSRAPPDHQTTSHSAPPAPIGTTLTLPFITHSWSIHPPKQAIQSHLSSRERLKSIASLSGHLSGITFQLG